MLRLRSLMNQKGIKTAQELETALGMRNAIYRWKTFKDKPTPDSLLKVAQYFGVPVQWLMTGTEASLENSEPCCEPRPLTLAESGLLFKTMQVVEEGLKNHERKLLAEQKYRLIVQIYNDCAEDGAVPARKMVNRYLSILENGKRP